jgi:hypothetical protein
MDGMLDDMDDDLEGMFGIRTSERGDITEHYVGYDLALFTWLLAENYEPCDRKALYRVKAPEGYAFLFGNLYPENDEDGGDDFSYVTCDSPLNDKALMLLNWMRHMERAEFYALGISKDRILDFRI